MRRARKRLVYAGVIIVLAGAAFFIFRPSSKGNKPGAGPTVQRNPFDAAPALAAPTPAATAPAGPPTSSKPSGDKVSFDDGLVVAPAKAASLLEQGEALVKKGQFVEGRAALADALNSGGLSAKDAAAVRAEMEKLAEKMIFSRELVDGDPCVRWYTIKTGDKLIQIERAEKLHVPDRLLLKINALADAGKLSVGQKLKVINGPFHAVVHKSQFVMDLYLQESDSGRMIFVKRYKIAVGARETPTPEGVFRLTLGGKLTNAPYTPPPSTGLPQVRLLPGQKDYPLDKKGLWMSLTGIPEKGNKLTQQDGYGIHGSNDPASIGKASSHGCIRLSDTDIEEVYQILYEQWSTVTIKP